jgi:hypothetical protein
MRDLKGLKAQMDPDLQLKAMKFKKTINLKRFLSHRQWRGDMTKQLGKSGASESSKL